MGDVIFAIGIFILGAMFGASLWSKDIEVGEGARGLLVECEKELPRHQHCKIIAVKEDE